MHRKAEEFNTIILIEYDSSSKHTLTYTHLHRIVVMQAAFYYKLIICSTIIVGRWNAKNSSSLVYTHLP